MTGRQGACKAAAVGAALLWLGCGGGERIAGGSTETGNPGRGVVTGMVVDGRMNAVAGAAVRLVPSWYNPLASSFNRDSMVDYTDDDGLFRIDVAFESEYTLEIHDPATGTGQMLFRNSLGSESSEKEPLNLGSIALAAPGSVTLVIDTSVYEDSTAVYIPGTDRAASVDASRYVTIDSVAADEVDFAYFDLRNRRDIGRARDIAVGDTAAVGHAWASKSSISTYHFGTGGP